MIHACMAFRVGGARRIDKIEVPREQAEGRGGWILTRFCRANTPYRKPRPQIVWPPFGTAPTQSTTWRKLCRRGWPTRHQVILQAPSACARRLGPRARGAYDLQRASRTMPTLTVCLVARMTAALTVAVAGPSWSTYWQGYPERLLAFYTRNSSSQALPARRGAER